MAIRRSRKERREEAIRRILEATVTLLQRGDLEKLSLARIAKASGVSKSLIFYYFHSKENLLFASQQHFFTRVLKEISSTYPGRGVDAALRALDEVWKAVRSLPPLFPLFVFFLKNLENPPKEAYTLAQFFDELRLLGEEAIKTFLGEEILKEWEIPLEDLRELLFLVFLGLMIFTPIGEDRRVSPDQVFATFKRILMVFVTAPRPSPLREGL